MRDLPCRVSAFLVKRRQDPSSKKAYDSDDVIGVGFGGLGTAAPPAPPEWAKSLFCSGKR